MHLDIFLFNARAAQGAYTIFRDIAIPQIFFEHAEYSPAGEGGGTGRRVIRNHGRRDPDFPIPVVPLILILIALLRVACYSEDPDLHAGESRKTPGVLR